MDNFYIITNHQKDENLLFKLQISLDHLDDFIHKMLKNDSKDN